MVSWVMETSVLWWQLCDVIKGRVAAPQVGNSRRGLTPSRRGWLLAQYPPATTWERRTRPVQSSRQNLKSSGRCKVSITPQSNVQSANWFLQETRSPFKACWLQHVQHALAFKTIYCVFLMTHDKQRLFLFVIDTQCVMYELGHENIHIIEKNSLFQRV